MRRYFFAAAVTVVAFAAGCTPTGSSGSGSSGYSGERSPMACTHWHNIMGDVRAGILTDAELRAKVSQVRDSATDPAVETAATHLLAGITGNNAAQIRLGYSELQAACS